MMNRVTLIGRLTKDPELRKTGSGIEVTNFTLAVNRQFKNQNGEREADFINIVCWRKTAELVCQYLKKGNQAAVDGRLQSRSYENDQGVRVYITEVVAESVQFLDPPNYKPGSSNNNNDYNNQNQNQKNYNDSYDHSNNTPPPNKQDDEGNSGDLFSGLSF